MATPVDDETWEQLVTTGTHAYAFFDRAEGSVRAAIDTLRSSMPGRTPAGLAEEWAGRGWTALSAAEFVGPFGGFAHLRVDGSIADLQDFVAALRDGLGIGTEISVAGPSYTTDAGVTMMAKAKKCAVVGLVRVWARRGVSRELLSTLHDELGDVFKGATIVYGGCDVLLELGDDELGPVLAAVLGPLQGIDDVVRTETALADFRRYDD